MSAIVLPVTTLVFSRFKNSSFLALVNAKSSLLLISNQFSLDVNAVDPQADSGRYERLTAAIRVSGWFRPVSDGAPQLDIPAARARR
jgi:hypothetical protein